MKSPSLEIRCPACGQESFLIRQPVYEGFKKVGESLHCMACRHEFATEAEVPFKIARAPVVFTEADRSVQAEVFTEGENRRICRYCARYVVNPFTQWCDLHRKEVAATDSCPHFEESEKPDVPAPLA